MGGIIKIIPKNGVSDETRISISDSMATLSACYYALLSADVPAE
jgi:hypothetical protein